MHNLWKNIGRRAPTKNTPHQIPRGRLEAAGLGMCPVCLWYVSTDILGSDIYSGPGKVAGHERTRPLGPGSVAVGRQPVGVGRSDLAEILVTGAVFGVAVGCPTLLLEVLPRYVLEGVAVPPRASVALGLEDQRVFALCADPLGTSDLLHVHLPPTHASSMPTKPTL